MSLTVWSEKFKKLLKLDAKEFKSVFSQEFKKNFKVT